MENETIKKARNFFKRLFSKRRYLDLNLLNQLKEKGITPLFLYSQLKEDCFAEQFYNNHTQEIERRNK